MAIGRKAPALIAISMGDPAGIGAEIILKSAAVLARRRRAPSLVVIGDLKVMRETARLLRRVPTPRPWTPAASPVGLESGLSVLAAGELPRLARRPGHPTVAGGEASFQYVMRGARMAMNGEVDALVTAPISKQGWHRAGHEYPGHSELVAEVGRARTWRMMFAGAQLKLVLVTVHIGLREVSSKLTRGAVLETIRLLHQHLREAGSRLRPRIGVLGFNPHAGEQGLFGDEEIRAINPAIKAARHSGIDAFGPLAPDTAFVRTNGRFSFDAVVAMYHDQGLIPLKTLEFDRAVNVTLGLPFIRTCPDHGTAFDIAGHGRANPASMIAAIEYASRAVDSRAAQRAA
jgi:4-hydroxythreonine-4-phosphate dehydrogenase